MKLSWALGGELLMREAPLGDGAMRDMLAREPYTVAGHWISVALAAVGVAVAIGTARASGRLRSPVLWLARIVGGLMVLRASYGAASDLAVLTGAVDGATPDRGLGPGAVVAVLRRLGRHVARGRGRASAAQPAGARPPRCGARTPPSRC